MEELLRRLQAMENANSRDAAYLEGADTPSEADWYVCGRLSALAEVRRIVEAEQDTFW